MVKKKKIIKKSFIKKVIKKDNVIEEIKENIAEGREDFEEGVEKVEKWILERRKFLIKLGLVVIFIFVLLGIAYLLS